MASEPKPNSPTRSQAMFGCIGVGIAVGGVVLLMLFFHSLGPGLWYRWSDDSATLKAAQETVKLFLDAVRNEDGGSAYALLSREYRARLSAQESASKKLDVAVAGGQHPSDYTLGAGKLSDDKGQATFEGFVETKDGAKHSFRLLAVKEGHSWRVDLFTVQK